jgi:hypothetical protein
MSVALPSHRACPKRPARSRRSSRNPLLGPDPHRDIDGRARVAERRRCDGCPSPPARVLVDPSHRFRRFAQTHKPPRSAAQVGGSLSNLLLFRVLPALQPCGEQRTRFVASSAPGTVIVRQTRVRHPNEPSVAFEGGGFNVADPRSQPLAGLENPVGIAQFTLSTIHQGLV